jgi:molecular chaperone DnaK
LDGIPPSPRGIPQIEVTFDIDANGILSVSAKDKATGKSQSVKIEASTSLSKDEIEKLKKEAIEHAADDQKKREAIEIKNQAETLVYVAEKSLRDAGDKVPADVKENITKKIDRVKEVKDGSDTEAVKQATQELSTELQKIGEMMYKGKGPDAPTDGNQPPTNS